MISYTYEATFCRTTPGLYNMETAPILFVLYLKFRSFNIKAEKVDSRITHCHEQAVEWVALQFCHGGVIKFSELNPRHAAVDVEVEVKYIWMGFC